ncbi:protein kinase [Amycolatopsis sp. NPDC006125]|uniref:protein kinase domain-containing protein n=1 Tax=Amycolatopsis sp. NPDC006125 TaxID=3156730 RepID=UPI0033B3590B
MTAAGDAPGDLVPLGDGPSATVFAGVDEAAGTAFALKVYPGRLDRGTRAELDAELSALAAVRGQAPVLVADAVRELPDGRCALRMELCAQSLPELVGAFGPMAAADAVALGRSLASALAAAHAAGVVHGGVTPGNVLFRPSGEAVLSDFGLALRRAFPRDPARDIGFLAPETLRDGTADERSDLYGLGAVLYLALPGRSPHQGRPGEPEGELVLRVLHEPAPPLERSDLPPGLAQLITALLARSPDARPLDAATVAARMAAPAPGQVRPAFDDFGGSFGAPPPGGPAVVPPPGVPFGALPPGPPPGGPPLGVPQGSHPGPPSHNATGEVPLGAPPLAQQAGAPAGPPPGIPQGSQAGAPSPTAPPAPLGALPPGTPPPGTHPTALRPAGPQLNPASPPVPHASAAPAGPAPYGPPAAGNRPAAPWPAAPHPAPGGPRLGTPLVEYGPADRPRRRPRRMNSVVVALAVLSALAVAAVLVLVNTPDELDVAAVPPQIGAPGLPSPSGRAVQLDLNDPVDLGDHVELSWRSSEALDFAVIVAAEGERSTTVLVQRNTSHRVPVDPVRKYCFLVQATDGNKVYESQAKPIRGANCVK